MPRPPSKIESAGILLFRTTGGRLEVFLAHPGGPFWAKKDAGAWTIPKGLIEESEEPLAAARREFQEETGLVPQGEFIPLGTVKQKAGKVIHAWALEGDADPARVQSNLVRVRSGDGWQQFPEVDRCQWFTVEEARTKLNPAQVAFVDRLVAAVEGQGG